MTDKFEQELALRISKARTEAGFTQEIVAQHLGIPRSAISQIENGGRQVSAIELRNFANLVDKPFQSFLESDNSNVDAAMGETIPDVEPGLPSEDFHINISRIRERDRGTYATQVVFSRRVRRLYLMGLLVDALQMFADDKSETIWCADGGQEVED